MDNLEGGVAYLREVILHDSLGIGDELEQEMARVVDSYQCEWQTTLNDPQRLALFRSYVNSDEADEAVQRQILRGQPQLVAPQGLGQPAPAVAAVAGDLRSGRDPAAGGDRRAPRRAANCAVPLRRASLCAG